MVQLQKILHIEDDPEISEITGMALELVGGLTLLQADRGEKALDQIEAFAPQLVLSDVQMPGLTGPETLERIRQIPGYENIPAVFLTARLTNECEGICNHPMDLGIIGKPFDPVTLADQLRSIWAGSAAAAA